MRLVFSLRVLLLGALCVAGGAAAAERIGDPLAGKAWSDENVCKECHNPDGNSTVAEYPRLGGQQAAYLYKQLRDFRDGRRRNVIMQALTQELGDAELANVSAHFAAQPVMAGATAGARPVSALGRSLFEQGDSARGIPACSACHGADGKGRLAGSLAYPAIGGQHRFYLRGQLQDWRSDTRRNSPDGVMNQIAKALGDKDIEALADYLSGL
ncbi:cytochrome c [Zoogloea sp. LCSB751]|uniref:c-type cytochrome n=1 Tax=Zoogloea sp. LCSB751 TaxID=1965277 RepID=UPI0009A4F8B0|nr:c-type cytochrome [Zoogloea sp. LCSB751]